MKEENSRKRVIACPYFKDLDPDPKNETPVCPEIKSPNSHRVVPRGFYLRSSDGKRLRRFQCHFCRRSFSFATSSPCYLQKKRGLNSKIRDLLCSGVSQRRIARLLSINPKTVARKLLFLAEQAKASQEGYLSGLSKNTIQSFQFDEMESFERSKCLPLSIALSVQTESRKILGFQVSSMPAKGPLARISLQKYGPRADDRAKGAHALFSKIAGLIHPQADLTTDQNPKYPNWVKPHFPEVKHKAIKGRRGCITGQGELKKIGFDPLFDLNHTCAMFRANVNRLFRRTWCTTKKKDRLEAHLALYVQYHNQVLT